MLCICFCYRATRKLFSTKIHLLPRLPLIVITVVCLFGRPKQSRMNGKKLTYALFQELLLYLDSHRNIVQSLNVIGQHLAEHSDDEERANKIKTHLSATNSRWDRVYLACTEWQTKLQTALMEVFILFILPASILTIANNTQTEIHPCYRYCFDIQYIEFVQF